MVKECLTFRNSLSSWGGYRGGCGPGAKDGEDLLRRTAGLPRRRVLPRAVMAGCAWDRTKVMEGSVGSGGRILSLSLSFPNNQTTGGRAEREPFGDGERRRAMRVTTNAGSPILCSWSLYVLRTTLLLLLAVLLRRVRLRTNTLG